MTLCNKPQTNQTVEQLLREWETSLSPELTAKLTLLHERRAFMSAVCKGAAVISVLPIMAALQGCENKTTIEQLQQQPWITFAAVQQQLFPADGNGPSARDLNAVHYLKFVLEATDTDPDDKQFLLDGIKWLDGVADAQHGQHFSKLNPLQQQQVVEKVAGSEAGGRWLSHLLLYIFEALLADPVYGGNPQGVGWQWLEHQPGFPQPPRNKRYPELG
ncbi:MAG: gluconate 2-dehydrogenase subunit 3 family protein [Gammaproteobacteria bacterium]|nr:gluconate 2-dehydrogenase subunit 3 family protein [Gammaproteobacteria bacterium]MDH5651680.1 gluconate 2-dehydrogenase subunit 3 family protein [Gammaproteobacteria bacterium]